jgi:glutaredoxin
MRIEIYGAEWCKWCQRAKQEASLEDATVIYYDIEKDQNAGNTLKRWFYDHPDMKATLPQIWIDGVYIGGYEMMSMFLDKA